MPDRRRHRGSHPEDARLFSATELPRLRAAVLELGWLLGRGYAEAAALKLVGDRHQLHRRQRRAVARAACAPERAAERARRRRPVDPGARVAVDGFNALVTVEAALSGGVLLRCADGLLRDIASVHGTWRAVEETRRALELLARALAPAAEVLWLFDRPVSNSGRAAALARATGARAEATDAVDAALVRLSEEGWVVATADGPLLDRARASCDVVGGVVAALPGAWVADLGPDGGGAEG